MSERVQYPQFELVGPPCETPGCKGVLVDHVSIRPPQEFFHECSVCSQTFHRVPAAEKLAEAVRVIERVERALSNEED